LKGFEVLSMSPFQARTVLEVVAERREFKVTRVHAVRMPFKDSWIVALEAEMEDRVGRGSQDNPVTRVGMEEPGALLRLRGNLQMNHL
jgi:hypothetical protein